MGLWSAISIGIGGMVGAGIFSILGVACEIGGNAVYLSFLIAGAVAMLSTYSYAKLGVKFPSAGGPVEFLVKAFGDSVISGGFNIMLWIGYIFALALYARAFAYYALTFFIWLPSYWINIIATAVILLFTAVNFIGAKAVGRSELLIVTIKVAILGLFAGAGIVSIKADYISPAHWPNTGNIFFAVAIVFLAYEGFGLITNAAEDMQHPRKTLPRALYMSVFIVILIYFCVSLVVVGNLSLSDIIHAKDYTLAAATRPFLGSIGFTIIAIAALFSTASAINATLYGGANVSYIMAVDGQLPRLFERKVWNRGIEGLFITAGLVIFFTNVFDLGRIAMLGSADFLLIYAAVNTGHLRLYKKTKARVSIIWLSIIGCLASFGVLVYYLLLNSQVTLIVLAVLLPSGFVIEWVYRALTNRKMRARSGTAVSHIKK